MHALRVLQLITLALASGCASSISLHDLEVDARGWEVVSSADDEVGLENPSKDLLALSRRPRGHEQRASLQQRRDNASRELALKGCGLISLDDEVVAGHPAQLLVSKCWEDRGPPYNRPTITFEGGYTFSLPGSEYRIWIVAREHGDTGYRETLVMTQLLAAGEVLLEERNGKHELIGWSRDPYDPSIESGLLRYRSDDPKYDAAFPEHPLSRLRSSLRDLAETIRAGP